MIDVEDVIRQLTTNGQAVRALVQDISAGQAEWKPGPDTWSMKQVMEHLFNEERIDFRMHLKEMLSLPPKPWGSQRDEYRQVTTCEQALEDFMDEREASISWLMEQDEANWEVRSATPFGPAGEVHTLSAGDVLVSWVAHDFLHLRQINELMYAWNEKIAAPYSVQYAGGW